MDQVDLMMTFTITALVLSPLWRLELPNNTLLIGFDIDVSGVPVSCIVEDDNIKRYMAYNNIGEGSMVQLTGNYISICNMSIQLSTSAYYYITYYEKHVHWCHLLYATFCRTNDPL